MSTILRELLNDSPLNQFRNLYCYNTIRNHSDKDSYIICISDKEINESYQVMIKTKTMEFNVWDSEYGFVPFTQSDINILKSLKTLSPFQEEFHYETSKSLNKIIEKLEKGLQNETSRNSR